MIDKDKNLKKEEILKKLEQLAKLQALLKDPRINLEDLDEEELEALLTQAEIMEEALKNYMYEFGLSLYESKKGGYYFKKFIDDHELRDVSELDRHHFEFRDKAPSFLERLMEYVPESRFNLNGSIETTVFDLCERDASMSDVLNDVINEEIDRCNQLLDDVQAARVAREEGTGRVSLEDILDHAKAGELKEFEMPEVGSEGAEEEFDVFSEDIYEDEMPLTSEENDEKSYQCGSSRGASSNRLPKVDKVRRVPRKPISKQPTAVKKENANDR